MLAYRTFSSEDTKALGAKLARQILAAGAKGKVVALYGDLGVGKTTFTQGFLKALGVRGRVTSPTFVLMKKFSLSARAKRQSGFARAYHIDAYRFRAPSEAAALGLKEIFKDPQAIVLVEWPERLAKILPKNKTVIRFRHGRKENERTVNMR